MLKLRQTKPWLMLLIFTLFVSYQCLLAQKQTVEEITDGKEYWIGFPLCGKEINEAIRGQFPMAIWISSKVDTRAKVEDLQTGSVQNVVIKKGRITLVPYGDFSMTTESEVVENKGIHIVADAPISVSVYISYKWTGEAYRAIPVGLLGKKYVTMNMYQDQLKQNGDYRPPQILIVATQDNTKLTYRPATETERGIKPGDIGKVILNKGQTFLILGSIKPNQSQQNSTDLTGTYISSNHPIAVFSGHTKAAFPRYQYTFYGRNGGFMRNLMIDMVWPIETLGKEYVSAPFKYAYRNTGQIEDDKGDLIRFVATEDGTVISKMKKDSSGMIEISPILQQGQFYDIVNQEESAYYSANKKVLVAQYGKTWWIHPVSPNSSLNKVKNDEIQNPSRNGQGMLISLTPIDRWTSYATWRSPAQIDNFLYATFKREHINYIYLDGEKLSEKFADSIKYIDGTAFAYVTQPLASGDHYMYGDTIPGTVGKEKAVFAAYAYGTWDRSKDGFAYGYPAGLIFNSTCEDSLVVSDTMNCGVVHATAQALPADSNCALLYNVFPDNLINYQFTIDNNPEFIPGDSKTVSYTLTPIDLSKQAEATIKVQTKSGKTQTINYEYNPEEIAFEPNTLDFGIIKEGDSVCSKTFNIVNTSSQRPATINNLYIARNQNRFKINDDSKEYPITFPFTLQPGESKTIEVCAYAPELTGELVKDSVTAELSCYNYSQLELHYKMFNPVVWIGDAIWENVPVGKMVYKTVSIINRSDFEVVLTNVSWPDSDKTVFPMIEGLPCGPQGGDFIPPLRISPHQQKTFTTYFKPDAEGTHQTEAIFKGNTNTEKLKSIWRGDTYTGIENDNSSDEKIKFLNDIIYIKKLPGKNYSINLYDILGKQVPCKIESNQDVIMLNISGLNSGAYIVTFIQCKNFLTKVIMK